MWRLIFWFLVVAALAWGMTWLAEQPGTVSVEWFGWHIEMPMALALAVLLLGLLVVWALFRILRLVVGAPFAMGDFIRGRRRRKAREAMTTGLTALLAGDVASAEKATRKALKLTPDDPMAQLLRAQSLLVGGDHEVARFRFRQMLDDPETEPAALHGLYELALREGDLDTARNLAEKALARYPHLPWAARAVLKFAALQGDWPRVRALLTNMRKARIISKADERWMKAVALTAEALALENTEPEQALQLALQAHKLDPALVPAAVVAGRLLAARDNKLKAAKVLEKTWRLAPHVDIAEVYAHLRSGDSPRERLERLQQLLRKFDGGEEGAVALARAAIDAQDWDLALQTLKPWIEKNPTARIFLLLAELEEKRNGDIGRMREWLRRARTARPDPAWVANGLVSPVWLPVTPDGELGAYEWKEPPATSAARAALSEPVPTEWLEAPAKPANTAPGSEARLVEAKVSSTPASSSGEGRDASSASSKPSAAASAQQAPAAASARREPAGEPTKTSAGEASNANVPDQQPFTLAKARTGEEEPSTRPRKTAEATMAAEAVVELPEDEFNRPPLPDDPGPIRNK